MIHSLPQATTERTTPATDDGVSGQAGAIRPTRSLFDHLGWSRRVASVRYQGTLDGLGGWTRWCCSGTSLKLVAGTAVVLAVITHLGAGPVLGGVRSVSPAALVTAVGLGLLTTAASAARWRLVARQLGMRLGYGAAIADCYRAQFLNSVLPAGVLGDVHRALDHGRRSADLGGGLRAVVIERAAGQAVVVAVGVAVLLAVPGPLRVHPGDLGLTSPAATVAAGVALAAAALGLTMIPRLHHGLASLAVGVRQALLTPRTGPAVLGLSVIVMAGHLALLLVAATAVGVRADPGELLPPLMLSLLSMGLPLNIGGWGPREATTALAFGAAGLGAQNGLAAAVAFGVLALASTLPGLGVLVVRRASRAEGSDKLPLGRTPQSPPGPAESQRRGRTCWSPEVGAMGDPVRLRLPADR